MSRILVYYPQMAHPTDRLKQICPTCGGPTYKGRCLTTSLHPKKRKEK